MDTPATSWKRPAFSPLNAEARQPTSSVSSISPLRVLRSSKLLHSLAGSRSSWWPEWQRKNQASIHRTAKHYSIEEGGHNYCERKCCIPHISPPLRFVLRLNLQKWGRICGTQRYKLMHLLTRVSSMPIHFWHLTYENQHH